MCGGKQFANQALGKGGDASEAAKGVVSGWIMWWRSPYTLGQSFTTQTRRKKGSSLYRDTPYIQVAVLVFISRNLNS